MTNSSSPTTSATRSSRTMTRLVTTLLAPTLVASACGDSEAINAGSGGDAPTGTSPTTTTPPATDPATTLPPSDDGASTSFPVDTPPDEESGQFIGLAIEDAGALAESQDRPWRVGRQDDELFFLTEDYVVGRVTFEVDDGVVTRASIEQPLEDAGPPTTVIGDSTAELVSGAIVRMITEDNSFGGGNPFETVYVATLITSSFDGIDPAAVDQVKAALDARVNLEFIADAEGKITDLNTGDGSGPQVAVVSVDDIRIDGERAEVDMGIWCGMLCGLWLTYEAEMIDGAWQILGTIGPIAIA